MPLVFSPRLSKDYIFIIICMPRHVKSKYQTNDWMACLGLVKTLLCPSEAVRMKMKSRKNQSWNSFSPVNNSYVHWEETVNYTFGWLVVLPIIQCLSSCCNRYLIVKYMPAPWVYRGALEMWSVTSIPVWLGS